jgi:hypothetical protein
MKLLRDLLPFPQKFHDKRPMTPFFVALILQWTALEVNM